MHIRLSQIPDTTPIKMTIALPPDTRAALQDYAAIYARKYGVEEKPETLIPFMLETFLASDSGFKRARKSLHQPPPQRS